MQRNKLDGLDSKLVELLSEDGRMPVGDLAASLGITAPTVRARIKNLESAGVLKIAGFIDPFRYEEMTIAIIGLSIVSYGKLEEALRKLERLDFVTWAAVVTGRYDVMVEVVFQGGMDELYRITSIEIPAIGGVVKSESFVIMKSFNKWVEMPRKHSARGEESS
jgi:Lrp/AsnC family transcriptional regulator, regulator for asnA, asnC and gidA